ncbi:glycosyltransferase family 4 protein [Shewanella sp.]|uniref:glycosyltransferase family 4 protein n=1 Tax=Shewanella sp. TaxID=50422 RepID=UPI003561C2CC
MKILVLSNQLASRNGKISNPVISNLNRILIKKGVEITEYSIDVGAYGALAYVKLIFKLILLRVGFEKYDRYHVHFGGIQGLLVSLFFSSKTIISFHGTDLHGGTPSRFLTKIKSKVNVFCSKLSIKLSAKSTVVSKNLLEYVPSSLLSKVVIIPTGVDEKHFTKLDKTECRAKLGLETNVFYLLFSDISGSTVKRRDIASKVIDLLNENQNRYKLLVMSQVDYSLVPTYLYAADYLLLTSDKEGSPNIVKEALYCNLKVLSTDVGDVSDYINKPDRGLVFSSNDPEIINNEINNYFVIVNNLGTYDFNSQDLKLSIENIADEYISIYEK